jgi:hypothetical protein
MMSRIDSRHWQISTGRHFQNGHHNTAQIQHCPISTTFHVWIDYDVPNWLLWSLPNQPPTTGLKNKIKATFEIEQCRIFVVLWWPFWKWRPVKNFRCHCPISTTFHVWIDYDVPNWFLTLKNFYRSPFSKWPPQYRTNSTLFNFNVLNWFPTSKNFYRSP